VTRDFWRLWCGAGTHRMGEGEFAMKIVVGRVWLAGGFCFLCLEGG